MGLKAEKIERRGWIFLALWAVLIVLGVVEKRFYDHPDRMAFFHFPAAVFLVLALRELSKNFRKQSQEAFEQFQRNRLRKSH